MLVYANILNLRLRPASGTGKIGAEFTYFACVVANKPQQTRKDDGLIKSQNSHLPSTELQDDMTSPPSVSWLFTTPTKMKIKKSYPFKTLDEKRGYGLSFDIALPCYE